MSQNNEHFHAPASSPTGGFSISGQANAKTGPAPALIAAHEYIGENAGAGEDLNAGWIADIHPQAFRDIRSLAYSILKCEYGWNGVEPTACRNLDDVFAENSHLGASKTADAMAREIHRHVGNAYFRPRIDRKANRRRIE